MRELIYHRHFFPALRKYAKKTTVIDGDYQATMEQHGDRVLRLSQASGKKSPIRTMVLIGEGVTSWIVIFDNYQ